MRRWLWLLPVPVLGAALAMSLGVSAQATDTPPPPTIPIGWTPTASPVVGGPCPAGTPVGYGTVTPSSPWLSLCGWCWPDLFAGAGGVTGTAITPVGQGTPLPTLTPTPTVTPTPVTQGLCLSEDQWGCYDYPNNDMHIIANGMAAYWTGWGDPPHVYVLSRTGSVDGIAYTVGGSWDFAENYTGNGCLQYWKRLYTDDGPDRYWYYWLCHGTSHQMLSYALPRVGVSLVDRVDWTTAGNTYVSQYGTVYYWLGDVSIITPTPTPVSGGYCSVVQSKFDEQSWFSFDLPAAGQSQCVDIGPYTILGIDLPQLARLCYTPYTLGTVHFLGMALSVDWFLGVGAAIGLVKWMLG